MKKLFIICALAAFQSACSTQAPLQSPSGALLEFADLAVEIAVNYEVEPALPVSSRDVRQSLVDSS